MTAKELVEEQSTGTVAASTASLLFIDPRNIIVEAGWNPRTDFGDLQELARSILTEGVIKPISVRIGVDNAYYLVDGERRYRASMMVIAKCQKTLVIPAIVVADRGVYDRMAHALLANEGKPFLPFEEAQAFSVMVTAAEGNGTASRSSVISEIATKLGKSATHIVNRLQLLLASDSVKEALERHDIHLSTATEIIRKTQSGGGTKGHHAKQDVLLAEAKSVGEKKVKARLDSRSKSGSINLPRKHKTMLAEHYKGLLMSRSKEVGGQSVASAERLGIIKGICLALNLPTNEVLEALEKQEGVRQS